ncbi:MAG TPA: hypothetical protein VN448_04295 [Gammaproteobacteria bacterium]|nr:hypothetical protein [Gammaproteobacteria bacterium]
MSGRVLMGLVVLALTVFSFGIAGFHSAPAVWRHLLFAVGVVPLILAAMLYFVPVLTRTAAAPSGIMWLPVAAAVLGVSTVLAFMRRPDAVAWIAGMFLIVVTLEIAWIWQRRNHVLGSAHPGLYWYLAALAALLLALTAVVLREAYVEYGPSLRTFHLHLNLLGFLGLTAIGTLRVLLPTTLAASDAAANTYLRVQLPYVIAATVCIALGAAVWPPLSWLGAVVWLWSAVLLLQAIRYERLRGLGMQHAALALSAACLGWFLMLLAGLAHGLGVVSADALMWLLVFLFLLPLVTGASSYLLPLWRWPGKMTQAHTHMRAQLMRFSGVRVLAFYLSGGMSLLNIDGAQIPAVIALLSYLAQVGKAFLPERQEG